MFVAQDVLGIDVGLTFELVYLVVLGHRVDLMVVFKGAIPIPDDRLGDDNPWIGV